MSDILPVEINTLQSFLMLSPNESCNLVQITIICCLVLNICRLTISDCQAVACRKDLDKQCKSL